MTEINMGQLGAKFNIAADKLGPEAERKLGVLSQLGVGYVKDEIQGMHAVDTGTMVNSTTAEKQGILSYLIGPTVLYAPYVALGTSRMLARPFHITAAARLNEDVKDFIKAEDIGL